jgi:hypothetical protein
MNKGVVVKDWFKVLQPQTNGAREGRRTTLRLCSGRKLRRDPLEGEPISGRTVGHTENAMRLPGRLVPNGNSNWLMVSCESADNRSNERSLPIDLVRDGRTRPLAGGIASRNSSPLTSAQCTKAQTAEANGPREHRSSAACWAQPDWHGGDRHVHCRDRDVSGLCIT